MDPLLLHWNVVNIVNLAEKILKGVEINVKKTPTKDVDQFLWVKWGANWSLAYIAKPKNLSNGILFPYLLLSWYLIIILWSKRGKGGGDNSVLCQSSWSLDFDFFESPQSYSPLYLAQYLIKNVDLSQKSIFQSKWLTYHIIIHLKSFKTALSISVSVPAGEKNLKNN